MGRVSVTPKVAKGSPKPTVKKVNTSKNALLRGGTKHSTSFQSNRTCSSSLFLARKAPLGVDSHSDTPARRPFKFKPLRDSPYKRPDFAPKSNLHTIEEESCDEDVHPSTIKSIRFEPGNEMMFDKSFKDNTYDFSDKEMDESSVGSDFEGWDDETTLVAKFQEG